MEEKFYEIDIGRATRYITLTTKNDNSKSQKDFYNLIKEKKIIFTEDRGRTAGDLAIGSWVTLFFSENFVRIFKKNKVNSFKAYPIMFESNYNNKLKYYYVEPISFVDKITDDTSLNKKEREKVQNVLDKWINRKNLIYFSGDDIMKTFYNMSTWDGSDFFGAKNSSVIIVTEKLKKIIEKAKLKNIVFLELKPLKYEN